MDRVCAMFTTLIPVLFLLASRQLVLDSSVVCAWQHCSGPICVCQPAKQTHSRDILFFEQSVRWMNRRLAKPFGSDGFSPSTFCEDRLPDLSVLHISSIGSQAQFGLAQHWQFYWRTALEPRAPSAAS
jgi:hypothetical protein